MNSSSIHSTTASTSPPSEKDRTLLAHGSRPALDVREVTRTRCGDQLLDVERDAPELHLHVVVDERVLAERLERDVLERLLVLVDEPDTPNAEPERAAEAAQPLQMDVARGHRVGVDAGERRLDLGGRRGRQDDVLVRDRRCVAAQQRACTHGRLKGLEEREAVGAELLPRPARGGELLLARRLAPRVERNEEVV